MKNTLKQFLQAAVDNLKQKGILPKTIDSAIQIERTRDKQYGDFSTNIAMVIAKAAGCQPRELAQAIVSELPAVPSLINNVIVAGPGFINFYLLPSAFQQIIMSILDAGCAYGLSDIGKGETVHIEFVSSNPTGPLHVGHGRSAAYGAAVADLLQAVGFKVHREYYVNDAGRQMDILATSVWLRYLSLCGEDIIFPANGYQGDYIVDIARHVQQSYQHLFYQPAKAVFSDVIPDEGITGGDKESHIDGLIANAKQLLGDTNYQLIFDVSLTTILSDIREDLALFGVNYQEWFSERSLYASGLVESVLERLQSAGYLYEQQGATWFRSTAFGDDKDRVVVRENGQKTYFASDIAYFLSKYERGFKKMILVTGSDHHGYIPRLRAAMRALGLDDDNLIMPLVQFAILYRGKERVQMSTRSGSFVTLRELREEVGKDAARFFYVWRKSEQHMDFDLELAKSRSNDNPVFYIQYAHARICSVFRQLKERNISWAPSLGSKQLHRLDNQAEMDLLNMLSQYPEIIEAAAIHYEPHMLAHYLRDLANFFHAYYNAYAFIVDDEPLRHARLNLIAATKQVLHNGLTLLGVSAPEIM